jgi:hypothetical protein
MAERGKMVNASLPIKKRTKYIPESPLENSAKKEQSFENSDALETKDSGDQDQGLINDSLATAKDACIGVNSPCTPKDTSQEPDYTKIFNFRESPEFLTALEKHYWNSIAADKPMYGADLMGSIFVDQSENKWNISKLESLLTKVGTAIPGVTTPYLYFGMYKATFAWHTEDMDLLSIKYSYFILVTFILEQLNNGT